jgi:hypothetical protein
VAKYESIEEARARIRARLAELKAQENNETTMKTIKRETRGLMDEWEALNV